VKVMLVGCTDVGWRLVGVAGRPNGGCGGGTGGGGGIGPGLICW
jgi:hypothetical protein